MEFVIDGLQAQHLGYTFVSKVSEEILKRAGQCLYSRSQSEAIG
jgi:hypothetical protein